MLAIPWTWAAALLLMPLAILLTIAFAEATDGVPPFILGLNWDNFATVIGDPLYRDALPLSLSMAGVTTAACLLLGYPMALGIARTPERWRALLLLATMLPFWTGFLMRINAWIALLRDDGPIAGALTCLGLGPLTLLHTGTAMYIGMIYTYLPLPGVWAGAALVFIPAVGEYVIPELLGAPGARLIGRVIWEEFFQNRDWPMAAALTWMLLLVLLAIPVLALSWIRIWAGKNPGTESSDRVY